MKWIIIFIILLSGCAGYAPSYTYQEPNWIQQYSNGLTKLSTIYKEYETEKQTRPIDINKIEELTGDMGVTAIEIEGCCKMQYCRGSYYNCAGCLSMQRLGNERTAEMMLFIAYYYANMGDKKKAKAYYRVIIVMFAGDAYRSFVRQAEFGLEDLKEN